MMIGGGLTIVAAGRTLIGTTLIRVWVGWSVDRQIPPSRGHANDAWAPDEPQVALPAAQAEQEGQNVQPAPGYSPNSFTGVPSQS